MNRAFPFVALGGFLLLLSGLAVWTLSTPSSTPLESESATPSEPAPSPKPSSPPPATWPAPEPTQDLSEAEQARADAEQAKAEAEALEHDRKLQAQKDDINAGTAALLAGDSEFAAAMYEEIINDDETPPPLRLFTQYKLAWTYLDLGREDEAHALMQQVVDADPSGDVQLGAVIRQAQKDFAEWGEPR
ncbi:MAG: hypothetical protein EA397_00065 [Deltaproteobacteria bacterium]|nr:MAG: hypothetical protein EA397_00065 [Deltaproteobacteria bacterium]